MAVQLVADGHGIELNAFVEGYLYNIVKGIGASLRGTDGACRLELHLENEDITLRADGNEIQLDLGKGFAKAVVSDTIKAVIKHLKRADRAEEIRICVDL
jgi:hypothetical protein